MSCTQCLTLEKPRISDPLRILLPRVWAVQVISSDLNPIHSCPVNILPVDWWPHSWKHMHSWAPQSLSKPPISPCFQLALVLWGDQKSLLKQLPKGPSLVRFFNLWTRFCQDSDRYWLDPIRYPYFTLLGLRCHTHWSHSWRQGRGTSWTNSNTLFR